MISVRNDISDFLDFIGRDDVWRDRLQDVVAEHMMSALEEFELDNDEVSELLGGPCNKKAKYWWPNNSERLKWSCFLGQVCGLAKMHLVCVHAALRVSVCSKYAMSGVLLSRAVCGRSVL